MPLRFNILWNNVDGKITGNKATTTRAVNSVTAVTFTYIIYVSSQHVYTWNGSQ
jgi:hypothetical protein